MKKIYFLPMACALLLWMSDCKPAYRIYSEQERGVNFFHYKTYRWSGKPPAEAAIPYVHINQETEERIRVSAQAQLARFAIEPCEDEADLTVHYHVLTKDAANSSNGWQCSGKFRKFQMKGYCESLENSNLQKAMLVLDIIEEKTGNQVWRGAAIGAFDGKSDEERKQNLEEGVRRIFEKFPGKPFFNLKLESPAPPAPPLPSRTR